MVAIVSHGEVLECNTISPLLITMMNTDVPVDKDSDGNIIFPDIFPIEDVRGYVKFSNTGIVDNINNVDLYRYMGYDVEDDSEYSKIILMMKNDGGMITEHRSPDHGFYSSNFTRCCHDAGIKFYTWIIERESMNLYTITTTIVITDDESLRMVSDKLSELINRENTTGEQLYNKMKNGTVLQFHEASCNYQYYEILWYRSVRDYCIDKSKSVTSNDGVHYTSVIPDRIKDIKDEFYDRLFNDYVNIERLDSKLIVISLKDSLDNINIPEKDIEVIHNVERSDDLVTVRLGTKSRFTGLLFYDRDTLLYMLKMYETKTLAVHYTML